MNETLFQSINNKDIRLDFTKVTDYTSLQNELKRGGGSYTLDTTATFNYSNGVSIRKGTGNIDNNTITSTWIDTIHPLVFKNCEIPKKIYWKARTEQVPNARCFASISIKVKSSVFNLIYFYDNNYENKARDGLGLFVDGYTDRNTLGILVKSLVAKTNNINNSFDLTTFPKFKSFIKGHTICDIIYQCMLNFNNASGSCSNYPFYVEKLEITF